MMTVIYIILAAIAVILLYLFVFLFPGIKGKYRHDKALFAHYAHRGLHNETFPENSLAAFKNAVNNGYGIELDVQLSKDGEVMVFHDYTLSRMTGNEGKLSDLTFSELRQLRLKDTDEQIPTLKEVLEVVDSRIPLLVELKGESFDTSLCPKVDSILSEYSGPYCIESFNPMLLRWYKKNRPQIMRGMLTTIATKDRGFSILNILLDTMTLNILSRPDFIAYDHRYKKLSVWLCDKLFHTPMFTWTIRDKRTFGSVPDHVHSIFEGFIPE